MSTDGNAELAFTTHFPQLEDEPSPGSQLTLVLGDDGEWDRTNDPSSMGGAISVQWDARSGTLRVLSSIVGLPPVFVYRGRDVTIVASELRLMRAAMPTSAAIDPQAALDLFVVGYPLDHRTLLKGVEVMPAGHALAVSTNGCADFVRVWSPPAPRPEASWSSYIEQQVEAFRDAMRGLSMGTSVLSLTGGLDTRAVLAVLAEEDVQPPACTMSGPGSLSLDARLARELCRAYGMEHVVVRLDKDFLRDLPTYVVEASRLSGGLASFDQAHEVYFQRQVTSLGNRRLSGNLGNQVGRQGIENVSMRNADTSVLHDALRMAGRPSAAEHWLVRESTRSNHTFYQLLLEQEVPFSSVGNYGIGHHLLVQQTPYANRRLIEITSAAPASDTAHQPFARRRARIRDLRHRFLGEPATRSFQRSLIKMIGGPAARCPINWGWRAKGGVSAKGLSWGVLSLLEIVSTRPTRSANLIRSGLRGMRADGIQEIRQPQVWLDTVLREFVNDSLRAQRVRESGLFDFAAVVRHLDEHYRGLQSHHTTLVAALDLALAERYLTD